MSITVADCLKLASLSEAKVVGGSEGLNNVVVSVSVLEYAVPTALGGAYFKNNEIVISAFISIKDDVEAQCAALRRLHEVGEVGLILYYVGIYMPKLDERLIKAADELGFPLICMPEKQGNLRYSEVICEVMEAIFKDQMKQTHFVGEILDRIAKLQNSQRNMDTVLRMISDRIHCMLILTDRTLNMLNAAAWPMSGAGYACAIVDYYKKHPDIMTGTSSEKIKINEKIFYTNNNLISVERGSGFNLIVVNEASEIVGDRCQQAGEIVRLFINIWSQNEGDIGSPELVKAILNDEPAKMRRLAGILNINISSIHIMWVLKNRVLSEEKEAQNTELMIRVKQFLKEQHRLAIVDIYEENVLVFMDNPTFKDEINSLAEAFMKELGDTYKDIILALFANLDNTTEVRAGYVLFEKHIKAAASVFQRKSILTNEEITFAADCSKIILQGEEAVLESLAPLKTLRLEDKEQEKEWINTLSIFMIDTQANMVRTSEILFIHKSTVKYRIHKINERLNYNILKLPEAYKLYKALAIERLLAEMK